MYAPALGELSTVLWPIEKGSGEAQPSVVNGVEPAAAAPPVNGVNT